MVQVRKYAGEVTGRREKSLSYSKGLGLIMVLSSPFVVYRFYTQGKTEDGPSDDYFQEIVDTSSELDMESKALPLSTFQWCFYQLKLLFRGIHLGLIFIPLVVTYPFMVYLMNWKRHWYTFLRVSFIVAGPLYIKLGQWISTRPDLFDEQLIDVMQVLHYTGYEHSYSHTRKIIVQAYGVEPEEIFEEFPSKPIGSGAIAQVYKAKIKESYIASQENVSEKLKVRNQYVAVKVRHPGIVPLIQKDFDILNSFLSLISSFDYFKYMNLQENLSGFLTSMKNQLDMRQEAINLNLFNKNFESISNIVFPRAFNELCRDPNILIETWEDGIPIKEFGKLDWEQFSEVRKALCDLGIVLYLKMLIADNLLHQDLHPGNMMGRINDDGTPSLIVLDCGLVNRNTPAQQKKMLDILLALSAEDGRLLSKLMVNNDVKYKTFFDKAESQSAKMRLENYERECEEIITESFQKGDDEVQVGEGFIKVLSLGRKYRIPMDANFAGIILATSIIEGVGRSLNSEMHFVNEANPVLNICFQRDILQQYFKGRFQKFKSLHLGTESLIQAAINPEHA